MAQEEMTATPDQIRDAAKNIHNQADQLSEVAKRLEGRANSLIASKGLEGDFANALMQRVSEFRNEVNSFVQTLHDKADVATNTANKQDEVQARGRSLAQGGR